ncbi:MAG TPA: hypothetical protein VKI61_04285 [Chitinophagaceae bacterium]|jgi:hypothetical protein|nr:hypothetical protein [Chitinophagaceae bacterium]
MFQHFRTIEHLTFDQAIALLQVIAHRTGLNKVAPFLYLNDRIRLEIIHNDTDCNVRMEKFKKVPDEALQKFIQELELKKFAKEFNLEICKN